MLQKFFFSLYKALIGFFGQGQPTVLGLADYRARIFLPVGLWTLVMAAGLVMIFYYVFNGKQAVKLTGKQWDKPWHWWATLLLAAGIGAQLAYYGVYKADPQAVSEAYCRSFIYVNSLVAALWFFLLSLIPSKVIPRHYTHASNKPF